MVDRFQFCKFKSIIQIIQCVRASLSSAFKVRWRPLILTPCSFHASPAERACVCASALWNVRVSWLCFVVLVLANWRLSALQESVSLLTTFTR